MKVIGAFQAKTHLSDLLEKVGRGESFLITKRGKPIASLSPLVSSKNEGPKDVLARFRKKFDKSLKKFSTAEIRELKNLGTPMKGILVDASVAASWLLRDQQSATAQQVLAEMQKGVPVFAPSLWLLEITNVLFNAERRRRIDRKHRDAALEQIERLPITFLAAPTLPDLRALRHYGEKYQLTAYDAEYLRVAKEQKLILATEDGNLLAAARRERVPLVGA